ncbi:hypothetical protein GCM10017562_01200 [Streptomyces roseofulvus]|uniref:hypothetical protein n=1 Tax=Streptomyces roseofulvus TaxID=33902 RepID=UPI0031F7C0F3
MPTFSYVVQQSHDQGTTWTPGPVTPAGPKWDDEDAARLASEILDQTYRQILRGDGSVSVPLLQVLVWAGPAQGAPLATSSTGTDRQWRATGDLIEEIANDIRHHENEKKRHEAEAASAQTAINNAKARLANLVRSAARMQMPQVDIAHRAGRSREWVRKTVA